MPFLPPSCPGPAVGGSGRSSSTDILPRAGCRWEGGVAIATVAPQKTHFQQTKESTRVQPKSKLRFVTEFHMVSTAISFNVCGDSADIDRYLYGDPECMIDYVDVPQARMGRVIRLLVNGSVNSGVTANEILERGVIVCTLIDVLNRMNVGVEVYLENCTKVGDDRHSILVHLHSSEQLLDVNNLMFALAHPSMLRRISFSVMEKSKWRHAAKISQKGGGYGQSSSCQLDKHLQADVVMQNFEFGSGDFADNAMAYVMSTVQGLGLVEC